MRKVKLPARWAPLVPAVLLGLTYLACSAQAPFQAGPDGDETGSAAADASTGTGPGADAGDDEPIDGGAGAGGPDSGSPDAGAPDAATPDSGMADAGIADGGPSDAGSDAGAPVLSRGLRWVRQNPMFISGLAVQLAAPSAAAADEYFDTFGATAVHLWMTGAPTEVNGWRAARPGARWLTWVQDDGTSITGGQLLGGSPANPPGRIGYQIGDEPQTLAQFQAMAAGAAAVRAADPDALIVLNYNDTAPLSQFLDLHATQAGADVYSYDNYSRKKDQYPILEQIRAAGLKHGLPYWRYLRAYYGTGEAPQLEESNCRWDAYVGLVYGFTGHTWFVYQVAANHGLNPGLFTSQDSYTAVKTPAFAIAAQLNRELRHLGRAITQLTSTEVRYVPAVSLMLPTGTRAWSRGAGGDPFVTAIRPASGAGFADLLAGFFVDDAGERYVMVQNLRHTGGNWPIDSSSALAIEVELDFGTSGVDATKVLKLDPSTGNVVPVPLTATGPAKGLLAVTLPAGGAVLFKYATGKSFALGP